MRRPSVAVASRSTIILLGLGIAVLLLLTAQRSLGHALSAPQCQPPTIVSVESDGPVMVGDTMHLTATVNGSRPLHYTWDFGDGSAARSGTGLDSTTHSYLGATDYLVRLHVKSFCGDFEEDESHTMVTIVSSSELLIAEDIGGPSNVDGDIVVYHVGGRSPYIGGYNVSTGELFYVGGQVGPKELYDAEGAAISGDWVVWRANAEEGFSLEGYIFGHNLETDETKLLTTEAHDWDRDDLGLPHISGSYVAWSDGDVWLYHIPTETVTQIADDSHATRRVLVDYPWLAWRTQTEGPGPSEAHVQMYNLRSGETTTPTAGLGDGHWAPDLAGRILTWKTSSQVILGLELDTSEMFTVTRGTPDWSISGPHTDGETIVWDGSEVSGRGDDVFAYDIATGETVTVTTPDTTDQNPRIDGSVLVWVRYNKARDEQDLYWTQLYRHLVYLPLVRRE